MSDKFDAVVFDMDGVIFDSERAVFECWCELSRKYGFEHIEVPYRACIGVNAQRTREIMLEAYGEDFPYDTFAKEASKMFHGRYDGGRLPIKIGVRDLLDYLKTNHIRTALASSTKRSSVLQLLGDAGLLDYFDAVICGDMVERSKPAPDIFLKACEALGVAPDRAYAIEDSYNGIRAAHAGHLRPIMVPDMLPADEEMRGLAVSVQDNLLNVIDYLKNM